VQLLVLAAVLALAGCQATGPGVPAHEPGLQTPAETPSPASTPAVGTTAPAAETAGTTATEDVPAAPPPVPAAAEVSPVFGSRSLYARGNPDFALLQPAAAALRGFPIDRLGRVDWVRALREDRIHPRSSVAGDAPMEVLDSVILMQNTREMPHVTFPHRAHTEWLTCSNCHPKPFEPRKGGNRISMDAILRGESCGRCHGRVAFSVFICERCHDMPHPGSPPRWW
jgi:c(7)-type cytochrome triheme protein